MTKKSGQPSKSIGDWKAPKVAGQTFCFVGKSRLGSVPLAKQITAEGGKVVKKADPNVDVLVLGFGAGIDTPEISRARAAIGSKTRVLNELYVGDLFRPTREEYIQMALNPKGHRVLVRLYSADESSIVGMPDLRGANLTGAKLTGLRLFGKLDGARFQDANLDETELPRKLADANFDGASLCSVRTGDLRNCSFVKADLSHAAFWNAAPFIEGCDFSDAKMVEFRFSSARRIANCSFRNANLNESWCLGRTVRSGDFSGCSARDANWSESKFPEAIFVGANLSRLFAEAANFRGADLTGAIFKGANLTRADLREAKIDRADFRGATLDKIKLAGVDRSKAIGLD